MDPRSLYHRAAGAFGERVHAIADHQWGLPTPCEGWDVRALVNHVVAEDLWVPPLFEGMTIEGVGSRYDGDVLGPAPKAAWDQAFAGAIGAIAHDDALDRVVHLSFGDTPASDYLLQLFADHLIHGWDLAQAIGGDERMDPELVRACSDWFSTQEEGYRSAGVIGPAIEVPDDADPQTVLLARFGRRA